jgi:amino acid transporter
MLWTLLLNGTTGFIMIITFSFCAGDLTEILSTQTGFPFIQAFYNATKSYAGATVMTTIIITMALCSTISNVATASRQMFAFARDQGLPFSKFISYVRQPQSSFLKRTWAHLYIGQTRLGHSSHRGLRYVHRRPPPFSHQHRQLRCL